MQVIAEPDSRKLLLPQKSGNLFATVILFSLFFPSVLLAADDLSYHKLNQNKPFSSKNKYQPYFEIGGVKYFNQNSTVAGIYDLFIPLLQKDDQLLFTDLRIFDRSGSSFEGNAHLGYRKLYSDTEQMFGVYGAFDRKRTAENNFFNQLTFGFEYWQSKFFIGGNIYKPTGVTQKPLPSSLQMQSLLELNILEITATKTQITKEGTEKSLPGADLELGYAITDNLTGYAGGYYFAAPDTKTVTGPRARLTYDYTKPTGRLLGILDGISIEASIQHDKPRRTSAYVGLKFKIGLTNLNHTSNIQGFDRHMVEPVRRDPDIVYQPTETLSVVSVNIVPKARIQVPDLIGHFGITKDTPPQELAKIYVYLVSYLVSHLGIVDKTIETGTYYLNLLYDAGSMLISSVSDVCRNYRDELQTPNGWWESKPRLEKLLGDKEFSKLLPISQKIAQKDHLKNIIMERGLTDKKDVDKLFRQTVSKQDLHPDKGGKAEIFYMVSARTEDLIKVLTPYDGKTVSKPDSNYYETPVGTGIPTKDNAADTTNSPKQPMELTAIDKEIADYRNLYGNYIEDLSDNEIYELAYDCKLPPKLTAIKTEKKDSTALALPYRPLKFSEDTSTCLSNLFASYDLYNTLLKTLVFNYPVDLPSDPRTALVLYKPLKFSEDTSTTPKKSDIISQPKTRAVYGLHDWVEKYGTHKFEKQNRNSDNSAALILYDDSTKGKPICFYDMCYIPDSSLQNQIEIGHATSSNTNNATGEDDTASTPSSPTPISKLVSLPIVLEEQRLDQSYCDSSGICHLATTNQLSTAAPISSQEEMDKLKGNELNNVTDTSNPSKQPVEAYQITYKIITTPTSWGADYGFKEAIAEISGSKNGDLMYIIITLGSKTLRLTPELIEEYYTSSDSGREDMLTREFGWKFAKKKELTVIINLFFGNKIFRQIVDIFLWKSPKLHQAITSTVWYGADTAFPVAAKIASINYKNYMTSDTWTWADTGDITGIALYYGISNYLKLHMRDQPTSASRILSKTLTAVALEVPMLAVKLPFEYVSYLRESDQTKKEKAWDRLANDGYAFSSYTSAGIVPFGYTLRDSYYYSLSESDLETAVIQQNIWIELRDTVVSVAMGFIFWYQALTVYHQYH